MSQKLLLHEFIFQLFSRDVFEGHVCSEYSDESYSTFLPWKMSMIFVKYLFWTALITIRSPSLNKILNNTGKLMSINSINCDTKWEF